MSKLEEYNDVMTRLVSETVSCTPAEWDHGTLTIDCDGHRIDYKLKNEEQPGPAGISEALRTLIDELYVRMSRHGDTWTRATITFNLNGNDLKFSTEFVYVQAPPQTPSPVAISPSQAASKKPWWKLGRA